ncbi:ankyrin repeat protein, partial [Baffinella frigidus]
DIEEKGGPGKTTPLLAAAERGHQDVVRLLLEHMPPHGANVRASDTFGWTPLAYAALLGHEEVARLSLLHGATAKQQEMLDRSSPLHCAAQEGRRRLVRLLLEHEAGMEATDDEGRTPLHRA